MDPDPAPGSALRAERLEVGYGGPPVVKGLTEAVPDGRITAIVGANGSGKSTLLRTLARLLRPAAGAVYLDGADIADQSTRSVAVRLGLLRGVPGEGSGDTNADGWP